MSISRFVRFYVVVFVFCFPFIFVSSVYNSSEFPKFIAIVLGSVFLYILFLLRFFKNIPTIKWGAPFLVLGLFLISLFVADLLGLDVRTSLLGSEYRLQGFILFLAGSMLFVSLYGLTHLDKDFKKIIIRTIFMSGFALSLLTILDFMANSSMNLGYRVAITLGNPNFLGGYLTMIFALLLFAKVKRKYALIALIGVAIILTGSKSALIASFIALVSVGFITKNKIYMGISILIILVSMFMPHRFSVWDNQTIIWQNGAKAVISRPILGYGQENFELIFPKNLYAKVDNAHNIFLELLVSSGVIGTGFFILFVGILLRHARWDVRIFLIVFLITASFNPLSISQWFLFWIIAPFALRPGEKG